MSAPLYQRPDDKVLEPKDHFQHEVTGTEIRNLNKEVYDASFEIPAKQHFIRDNNEVSLNDIPTTYVDKNGNNVPVFAGSSTNINPTNDTTKKRILDYGLDTYETDRAISATGNMDAQAPISPLLPFTRLDPYTAQVANLTTYNLTKTPIADLEHRKAFRHVFISRPECYIMSRNPNGINPIISQQCEYDEDFSSAYSRMPHILSLLSPIYVTGSFSQNNINSNWNYLLSNRILGLESFPSIELDFEENMTRSTEGYTVSPAKGLKSRQGSTITLSFQETRYLEIQEMIRLWMLYMYKRKKGIFTPSYNGYQYTNGFLQTDALGVPVTSIIYHAYDRAMDYTCSMFDIITNESMTKILYWCKYYGMYPTKMDPNMTNTNNGIISQEAAKVSVTFKYQYKLECVNKTLVEFNYNAGITDDLGRVNKDVATSHPFLLKDEPNSSFLPTYIGPAGMFTASPYIVLGKSQNNPLRADDGIVCPYLKFMPLTNQHLNATINMGIINNESVDNRNVIGIIDQ